MVLSHRFGNGRTVDSVVKEERPNAGVIGGGSFLSSSASKMLGGYKVGRGGFRKESLG